MMTDKVLAAYQKSIIDEATHAKKLSFKLVMKVASLKRDDAAI